MSDNDDKILQSIGYRKTYAYGTCKDIVHKNEKIKYSNITSRIP